MCYCYNIVIRIKYNVKLLDKNFDLYYQPLKCVLLYSIVPGQMYKVNKNKNFVILLAINLYIYLLMLIYDIIANKAFLTFLLIKYLKNIFV